MGIIWEMTTAQIWKTVSAPERVGVITSHIPLVKSSIFLDPNAFCLKQFMDVYGWIWWRVHVQYRKISTWMWTMQACSKRRIFVREMTSLIGKPISEESPWDGKQLRCCHWTTMPLSGAMLCSIPAPLRVAVSIGGTPWWDHLRTICQVGEVFSKVWDLQGLSWIILYCM